MLIVPVIAARDTKITVKAEEKRFVFVQVDDAITQDKIQYVNLMTDTNGIVSTTITSDASELNIFIRVTDTKGVIMNSTKYDSYPAGESLVVDFQPKNETETVVPETNETEETGTQEG